jgi:hypothetical protein
LRKGIVSLSKFVLCKLVESFLEVNAIVQLGNF